MTAAKLPPVEFLRECFDYDQHTGAFRWRVRPEHHFVSLGDATRWNSRHSGTQAFTTVAELGHLRTTLTVDGERRTFYANRVAWKLMTGEEPEMVDHRDRDPANNRFRNLRPATCVQNNMNRVRRSLLGLPKGVTTQHGKFVAAGHRDGKRHHLGTFSTPSEAHAAYCAWTRPLHGEFFTPGATQTTVFD